MECLNLITIFFRSVSVLNGSGEPPEKFVKYLARHEYKLEIDFTEKVTNFEQQILF